MSRPPRNMSSTSPTMLVNAGIERHGLNGLSDVLQKTESFIAGSYTIPIEDLMKMKTAANDDRDIDIWVIDDIRNHQGKHLAGLVRFLVQKGYSWPKTSVTLEGEDSHYARMMRSIRTVYTLKCETRVSPPIQILVLRPEAGLTPESIVNKFDLTLMMRWYDGEDVTILPEAAQALRDRVLKINISKDIEKQSMYEWIRTAQRFQKYTARDFELQWQADPLNRLLLNAAAKDVYSVIGNVLSIYLLGRWNKEIRTLEVSLPYLAVTMCPETTLSGLRVFQTMNRRFLGNPNPRMLWNDLTPEEKKSAIPVQVSTDELSRKLCRKMRVNDRLYSIEVHAVDYFASTFGLP